MTIPAQADLAVRLARATFNRALASADLAAIGPLLAPDVVLVTGTDSAVIAGRKAQLQAWKREFSVQPRTIYTRTTQSIIASTVEPIAMEQGHWQGLADGATAPLASGTYAAKWRKMGDAWLLIAEIFVTLS
ncbi:MAG: hypothetical protein RIS85_124 [Pseudomonadota bacterium]|jgi:ketosteroid isomerase-like protein